MAYRDSVSERNLDPVWISAHLSPIFCCSMNPRPWRLASVHRHVSLFWSKKDRMGAVVRDCFVVANAWSSSGDYRNSFLVLSRDRRGANRPATVGA